MNNFDLKSKSMIYVKPCAAAELASVASKEIFFGVYRDFGQRRGENWSSVQGYDSNKLAGMVLIVYY